MPARAPTVLRHALRIGAVLAVLALGLRPVLGAPGTAPHPPRLAGMATNAAKSGVPVMRLEGQLSLGTLALLQRSLRQAEQHEAPALLIVMDTPGGEVELMWQIAKAIEHAREGGVRVFTWVEGRALSAGVLVALSCERIYMAEHGAIGAATPITIGPGGIEALSAVDAKAASAFKATVRAWAEAHGRSPALAEAMVDPEVEVLKVYDQGSTRLITGQEWNDARLRPEPPTLLETIVADDAPLTLTASQAVELGFADGLADSIEEALEKMGRAGEVPVEILPTRSEDLLARMNKISLLLLIAGLVLAFVEFKVPGFGVPGILSIVCFGLLFTARYLVGLADIPHIVLAVVGITMIAVELFVVPGTIWVGLAGFVLFLVGVVFGQLGPEFRFTNALDQRALMGVAREMVFAMVGALAGAWILSRFLPKVPVLSRLVLAPEGPALAGEALPEAQSSMARPGQLGRASSDLRPVGKVVLDQDPDNEYEARAPGQALVRGDRVRVLEVVAGRLLVEAHGEGNRDAAS